MTNQNTLDRINAFEFSTLPKLMRYDAFGKIRWQSQADARNSNKFVGGHGIVDDSDDDGLIYMRARYYDPEVGRFISRDPSSSNGFGAYMYCYNNPVKAIDTNGLEVKVLTTAAGAHIGGSPGSSSTFGHTALQVNGKVYSFVPGPEGGAGLAADKPGTWKKYDSVSDYKKDYPKFDEQDMKVKNKQNETGLQGYLDTLVDNPQNYNILNSNCTVESAKALQKYRFIDGFRTIETNLPGNLKQFIDKHPCWLNK